MPVPSAPLPGHELLRARLQKAAAVPPDQRSANVADFVLYSSLLDEALDLLVPSMGDVTRADPDMQTRGLTLALKAHLLFIEGMPVHYRGHFREVSTHCHPYLHVVVAQHAPTLVDGTCAQPTPAMAALLHCWRDAQLLTLLKVAMAAVNNTAQLGPEGASEGAGIISRLSLAVTAALQRRLADAAAAAAYERQLAAAQVGQPPERCLSLAQLQQVILLTRFMATNHLASTESDGGSGCTSGASAVLSGWTGAPPEAFGPHGFDAIRELELALAHQLAQTDPFHPQYRFQMADIHMGAGCQRFMHAAQPSRDSSRHDLTALQQAWQRVQLGVRYMQEAIQLAENANRPYWVCRTATRFLWAVEQPLLASRLTSIKPLSAAEISGLKSKATSAFKHCRKLLPQMIWSRLEADMRGTSEEGLRGALATQQGQVCTGCGKQSCELRKCSGCREAAYCSRQCQVNHWPQHKAACRAAARAGAAQPQ